MELFSQIRAPGLPENVICVHGGHNPIACMFLSTIHPRVETAPEVKSTPPILMYFVPQDKDALDNFIPPPSDYCHIMSWIPHTVNKSLTP